MRTLLAVLFFVVSLLTLPGCGGSGPVPIDPKVEWLDYSDARTGYAIKYPATYQLVPGGGGEVGFKGPDKKIAYRICVADYESAKKRGLWVVTEPVGTVYVSGGHISHHYVYDYKDGFAQARTSAYVVELNGKMVGLEFRLDKSNDDGVLDEGQQAVLNSFTIL